MNIPFVDLKAQYLKIKDEIDEAVNRTIQNTSFIGGEEVLNFSSSFAKIYGVKHCVPLANGTDALYVAMKMLGIGPGDEVITTASSWISTSETITQTGARPVFVDIDDYYTINPSVIEKFISDRTRAIIPVHLYGQMCDMRAINQLAKSYNLKVIEDCAQSHFSELEGIRAGLWGDVGTFSFYPGKNLGAYGDAGCIITNNSELADLCRIYANHGALKKHHHIMEGINSRMDGIQASILNVKLNYILEWTDRRNYLAMRYIDLLKSCKHICTPLIRENSKHSFHVFAVLTDRRDELKAYLGENGISCQIHYPKALPLMPAYDYLGYNRFDIPNSSSLQARELSLPIYPELSEDSLRYIVLKINEFFGN